MPATRKPADEATEATPAPTGPVARRVVHDAGVPSKVGRPRNTYAEWAPEIESLRTENLGKAFSYPDVENVGTIASGLRRTYGVNAAARDMDKESKSGTLWIEYPSVLDEETGERTPDEGKVAEIKAKYQK